METKKAKVIMLPTKDKTNIIYNSSLNILDDDKYFSSVATQLNKHINFQHLYFTTDDEIKEGDWVIWKCADDTYQKSFETITKEWALKANNDPDYYKIIATTDKSLTINNEILTNDNIISEYLPKPSQAFIEKYCKVSGIDEVLVEYERLTCCTDFTKCNCTSLLGDLIPKVDSHNTITIHPIKNSWSTEEVVQLLLKLNNDTEGFLVTDDNCNAFNDLIIEDWIKENL